jgi:ferredoxin-fold anticodon binding domain-containing protein
LRLGGSGGWFFCVNFVVFSLVLKLTKPEFDVFMLFKDENNKELVTQAMNLLRRFISNDIITLEVKIFDENECNELQ